MRTVALVVAAAWASLAGCSFGSFGDDATASDVAARDGAETDARGPDATDTPTDGSKADPDDVDDPSVDGPAPGDGTPRDGHEVRDATPSDGPEVVASDAVDTADVPEIPCDQGPCCLQGRVRPEDQICDQYVERRCGGACGAPVEGRTVRRHCPGDGEWCSGVVEAGSWATVDHCDSSQVCQDDVLEGATCVDCPGGCVDGACVPPVCGAGPCCDGLGGFLPASHACQTALLTQCLGVCGGAVQQRSVRRHCSGLGSACNGAVVDDDWATVRQCEPGWACDAAEADCRYCDGGCDASGCLACTWTWSPVDTGDDAPAATAWHAALWLPTNASMLVAGGLPAHAPMLHRYDPLSDAWSPGEPCEVGARPLAVWTGAEVLLWSGVLVRYDPFTGTCTPGPTVPGPPAAEHGSVVWTGQRWIAWGGGDEGSGQGAILDPASGAGQPTGEGPGCPTARRDHVAAWTGAAMVVWGGRDVDSSLASGARYDPVADAWTPTSEGPGRPSARSLAGAVWTGSRLIIWGGQGPDGALGDGAAYDPAADAWTPLPALDAPHARVGHSTVWTGREVVVWGGAYPQGADWIEVGDGGRYDPEAGTWTPIPAAGAPTPRAWHSAVWTGKGMVVWGGQVVENITPGTPYYLGDGGRYRCTAP